MYYAHLAFVRFKHSVCHASLMTTYDHLWHFMSLYKPSLLMDL